MRRLKRSAERAAASSHGLANTVRFNASRRIPSWNCIARENSTGSLEEDLLTDVASSFHQGASGPIVGVASRNSRTHHNHHDGSDSESESMDLNSWTRSGGPLMRTTSANKFIDFVQNLDLDVELNRSGMGNPNSLVIQMVGMDQYYQNCRVTTSERSSESAEVDQRDLNHRAPPTNGSCIMVNEGDLLQPEKIHNGIVFNVVKKEDLTVLSRTQDLESYASAAECVQLECPEKETDASSVSEYGEDDMPAAKSSKPMTSTNDFINNSGVDGGHDSVVLDS